MKYLLIAILTVYQKIVSPLLHQLLGARSLCRYSVSCSHYAKEVIGKHGVVRGSTMALHRFLLCQPLNKNYANS